MATARLNYYNGTFTVDSKNAPLKYRQSSNGTLFNNILSLTNDSLSDQSSYAGIFNGRLSSTQLVILY